MVFLGPGEVAQPCALVSGFLHGESLQLMHVCAGKRGLSHRGRDVKSFIMRINLSRKFTSI